MQNYYVLDAGRWDYINSIQRKLESEENVRKRKQRE